MLLTFIVGGLLLLAPRNAAAAQIRFEFDHYLVHFGLNSASVADQSSFVFKDGIALNPNPNGTDIIVDLNVTSGPLLDLSVTTDSFGMPVRSRYEYGPGEVTVTGHWRSAAGDMTGTFVAPIGDLTINVREDQCTTGPGGGLCNNTGMAMALLGPGVFNETFQDLFGIGGTSVDGVLGSAAIDRITGTPSSNERLGGAEGSWGVTVNVPEPTVGALLLVAAGAVLRRVKRRTTV